jgi:N-methylhydantoinase A
MQSNGGISTIENSSDRPIGLLLSGPAGGVIGARSTGEKNDISNIITIDIGGTSADISVIQNGDLRIKNPRDTEVASLPVLVPMLDIDAIGAGGGSIAYVDDGGAFRVGPKSAGAVPGPACYGNGGEHPTVTDAQVVLGRLDQEQFLGGDIVIKPELAEKAIKTYIADPLGMSVTEAALGILKIINNNMALAINSNSVAKGIDPRGFTLMGFGGAGPLHAVALAEMISAKNIISPSQPGITAALGLLVSDLKYEYTRSVLIPLNQASDHDLAQINQIVEDLKVEADQQLDQDNVPKDKRQYEYIMECRYLGQGFELRAKMPNEPLTTKNVQVVIDNFYNVHKQQYGHAFKDQITEAITVRVVASADVEKLQLNKLEKGGSKNPEYAHLYNRDTVFDDNKAVSTPRYDRGKLKSGDTISGPAVVTQHNSTTIIPPDYTATILEVGDILIEKN